MSASRRVSRLPLLELAQGWLLEQRLVSEQIRVPRGAERAISDERG
jgi:hypothetical protein